MTLVAIHQPNFFPWLGYFDKIRRSDVFIFLDHVQFSKTGGTWSNRVRVRVGGEAQWITAPVHRDFRGVIAINRVTFDDRQKWRTKLFNTIVSNYGRAAHFKEIIKVVEPLIFYSTENMADFNLNAAYRLAEVVALRTDHCHLASELGVEAASNALLIRLISKVGGNSYLCGGGAGGYQDDAAFAAEGIRVVYQNFDHPVYQQGAYNFLPGLSILDALMHLGANETGKLLRL